MRVQTIAYVMFGEPCLGFQGLFSFPSFPFFLFPVVVVVVVVMGYQVNLTTHGKHMQNNEDNKARDKFTKHYVYNGFSTHGSPIVTNTMV